MYISYDQAFGLFTVERWSIIHPDIRLLQKENNCKCLLYMDIYNHISLAPHMGCLKWKRGASGCCWKDVDSRRKQPTKLPGHPLRQADADLNDTLCCEGGEIVYNGRRNLIPLWRTLLTCTPLLPRWMTDSALGSSLSSRGNLCWQMSLSYKEKTTRNEMSLKEFLK